MSNNVFGTEQANEGSTANAARRIGFTASQRDFSNEFVIADTGTDAPIYSLISDSGTNSLLAINWTGDAPDHWAVDSSTDGENWINELLTTNPESESWSDSAYSDKYLRAYGVDAGQTRVTPFSNSYHFAVALATPAPILEQVFEDTWHWLNTAPIGYVFIAIETSLDGVTWMDFAEPAVSQLEWGFDGGQYYRARYFNGTLYTAYGPVVFYNG